jgi:ATP-dependent RNA helicase RhlE
VFRLPASHKRALLAHLITAGAWEQVLVFTRTKHGANRLAEYLDKHGLPPSRSTATRARTPAPKPWPTSRPVKCASWSPPTSPPAAWTSTSCHTWSTSSCRTSTKTTCTVSAVLAAGRSGEAISLVAPDEEKLLKSIERMTKQKIADGDLMGFDASAVEAEKPEVRERPDMRNPRNPAVRAATARTAAVAAARTRARTRARKKAASERGERPAREQKPREGTPAREQRQPSQPPRAAADRAPDEFLDDDIDNFGNRVDYVPKAGPGSWPPSGCSGTGRGAGAPRGGKPQGRQNGPRNSNGASTGTPPAKRSGPRNGAPRDGQARREDSRNRRPARDDQQRAEPAVQNPRHRRRRSCTRSRRPIASRHLSNWINCRRPREKPALLTRNR